MDTQLFENKVSSPLVAESKKVLSGKFAELDKLNENGRNYPARVYTPAYEALVPKIGSRRLMGELDHPLSYDEVRLANVSHVITECRIEGKEVMGKVELLDTPSGLVAQALVEAGIPLGISSRGLGATKKVREGVEVTKLKLITFDLVAEPSFSDAILLNESVYEGLCKNLESIEEKLPLNESVETQSVRDMITRIRESVKLEESNDTSEEDVLRLLESEIKDQEPSETELRESIELRDTQISHLEGLVEARDQELSIQSKIIQNQQRIIENLKIKASKAGVPAEEIAGLVESVGQLTIELEEKTARLTALEGNMEGLQENYNVTTEKERTLAQELEESQKVSERLEKEVLTLRKKLVLESKGLSWQKHGPLLEGCTTEREMLDKLKSISHYGSASVNRVDAKKVVESLTEGQLLAAKNNRLAGIVSRV